MDKSICRQNDAFLTQQAKVAEWPLIAAGTGTAFSLSDSIYNLE